MKNVIDLQKILKKDHEEKWVALTDDYKKVIDFSENLVDLKGRVGIDKVIYIKVPTFGRSYAFIQN
jgi:hypothetical protein